MASETQPSLDMGHAEGGEGPYMTADEFSRKVTMRGEQPKREWVVTPFRLVILSLFQAGLILVAASFVLYYAGSNRPALLGTLGVSMIIEAICISAIVAWLKMQPEGWR